MRENASKKRFLKSDAGPFEMLKQVFFARFEPMVTCFGPWNIPKCLQNGPFWDQQWVKNGSQPHFSKSDRGPFGMLKQAFLAHFQPVLTQLPLSASCRHLVAFARALEPYCGAT